MGPDFAVVVLVAFLAVSYRLISAWDSHKSGAAMSWYAPLGGKKQDTVVLRSKIRVLMVGKVRTGGGTEKHIADISRELNRRGWVGVDVAYTEDGFWRLFWKIWRGRYDIVHMFLPRPYLLGSIACELVGHRNRIMSRRSLRSCYQTPLIRRIEELLHRRTKTLVANSPQVFAQLAAEASKKNHMYLIRNGVSKYHGQDVISPTFNILCVGNAFPYKGHEDLIAAIARIGSSLPEPWELIFIGKGTEKYNGFRVRGLGHNKVSGFWWMADLFILPSHEEGCSNALLEAMAAGVPVIATDVGGNSDAIIPGQTGLLVPPKDPERLGSAILTLANNLEMRIKLAAAARDYVAIKFSMERCVDNYEYLYYSATKR